jgi:hypothetical protein
MTDDHDLPVREKREPNKPSEQRAGLALHQLFTPIAVAVGDTNGDSP